MAAPKVSKNQRVGVRQKHKPHLCTVGHEQKHVLYVGQGFRWDCECTGYTPIDTSKPYNPKKGRIKVGGNARVWYEGPTT